MTKTLVIAECGSCHDASIERAFRLIETAKSCGADVAKFQYWSSPERLAERRHAPEYLATYRRYQIPTSWLEDLKAKCDDVGIEFMCTTYLPEDVKVVSRFVRRLKVSSFEASDLNFVARNLNQTFGEPWNVIISLGMADGHDAPGATFFYGVQRLHCVSAYPAPLDQLNLAVLRHRNCREGLSDHSGDVLTGAFAVCAGAEIIEVHLKLPDTDPSNPDAGPFALLPDQLTEYISLIRKAEAMLGDGSWKRQPCEEPMAKYRVTA